VASNRAPSELLAAAGFVDVEEIDFTGEFLQTVRRWLRHARELEPGLRRTLGDEAFDEQFTNRTDMLVAIEAGLLKRSLLVGAAPPQA
jgi:hypothetical protein